MRRRRRKGLSDTYERGLFSVEKLDQLAFDMAGVNSTIFQLQCKSFSFVKKKQ